MEYNNVDLFGAHHMQQNISHNATINGDGQFTILSPFWGGGGF
jgi:hypothetical protein